MSRIGRTPINIPSGVTVTTSGSTIEVKGAKGTLSQSFSPKITIEITDDQITVKPAKKGADVKALHGLTRSLLANMVTGVSEGYTKKLEMVGTGYRAKKQGDKLVIAAGYSHPVEYQAQEGVTIDTEGETIIVVTGIDKQKVGQTAAEIRDIRRPEPYKGKGIRYQGEIIRRKAGKAAKVGA